MSEQRGDISDQSTSMDAEQDQEQEASRKKRRVARDPSASTRPRRAAQACTQCRASKIRCHPPDALSADSKCAYCARMDRLCTWPDEPPYTPVSRRSTIAPAERDGSGNHGRLAKLEETVTGLLEMLKDRYTPSTMTDPSFPGRMSSIPAQHTPESLQQHTNGLDTLAHFAVPDVPHPMDAHLSTQSPQALNLGSASTAFFSGTHPGGNTPPFGTSIFDSAPTGIQFALTPSGPPKHIDTGSTSGGGSIPSHPPVQNENSYREGYPLAEARPLPRVAVSSRMAALSDPSVHEAPFRPLVYNPDTYKNAEFSRAASPVDDPAGAFDLDQRGGKTPKRSRADPIDRGVFNELEARALFTFFMGEIELYMPIFQANLSFDHVRHRSSFLLSTMLAVACKYCCANDLTPSASGTHAPLEAYGVEPVSEEKWLQIRALAMSSHFQALISKVHCLEDVQATLLLCAWGLQDRGASPDPWMMAGTAYRLARRLGLHLVPEAIKTGATPVNGRLVASWQTYLCLYAYDRFLTVGFGRPETEGFDPSTLDTNPLLAFLHDPAHMSSLEPYLSRPSAARVVAYVELANIARTHSTFVNGKLKVDPGCCLSEMERISGKLDAFARTWLGARSSLAAYLGLSRRPVSVLYNHIRLCLHTVPLKPASHPASRVFLHSAWLEGDVGAAFLKQCLRKAEESAASIVQTFADDSREDGDAVLRYSYDYACMVLLHSAATLLHIANTQISGVVANVDLTMSTPGNTAKRGMDQSTAMRYCGTALTALISHQRSANRFSCDMAGILSLIAKETGMVIREWVGESVAREMEDRAAAASSEPFTLVQPMGNPLGLPLARDFSLFGDLDMFLQPGFFDE